MPEPGERPPAMARDVWFACGCVGIYLSSALADSAEVAWQGQSGGSTSLSDDQLAAFGIGESVAAYAQAFQFMWLGVLARMGRAVPSSSGTAAAGAGGASAVTAAAAEAAAAAAADRARTLRMGWLSSVLVGLPLMVLVQALARPVCAFFGPSPAVLALAVPYLRVHLCGLVPMQVCRLLARG